MTAQQERYEEIGQALKDAQQSQMFGKPCFKIGGKAFISFFQNEMVFKLEGEAHKKALGIEGAKLFDPSGKNRPMKEWVQIPFTESKQWKKFAAEAFKYVGG